MDPKCVEFAGYEKLPHLYSPVVRDPEQGVAMLKCLEAESERRLSLLGEKGCRTIADLKKLDEGANIPYLVVMIDEFADFTTGIDHAFESLASRIAAKGMVAGIVLMMASSRHDVIAASGSLMANISSRLVFRVGEPTDSETLLGASGAEELLGSGDVLFKDDKGTIVRLQVPYIRDEEIAKAVDLAIARYPGRQVAVGETLSSGEKEDCELMYERAVEVVRTTRRSSTSWLQRQLNIGYNDAARVMSLLEERGIIGPANDNGAREILIKDA